MTKKELAKLLYDCFESDPIAFVSRPYPENDYTDVILDGSWDLEKIAEIILEKLNAPK